jgi:hypothetical protein
MNNFTFGDAGMGYYETIAGGAGAGPGWHGRRWAGARVALLGCPGALVAVCAVPCHADLGTCSGLCCSGVHTAGCTPAAACPILALPLP